MTGLHILVACERSNVVRDAFNKRGHKAVSVDLEPGADIQGDALDYIGGGWDIVIAHPPCQYLSVSGYHWNYRRPERQALTEQAVEFFMKLWNANADRVCLENPVSIMSTRFRKPDQIIQPWMFGHDASKKTCLWLRGLPKLIPTNIITKERYSNQTPSGQNKLGPSPERAVLRARTYEGIAEAMAEQWG